MIFKHNWGHAHIAQTKEKNDIQAQLGTCPHWANKEKNDIHEECNTMQH